MDFMSCQVFFNLVRISSTPKFVQAYLYAFKTATLFGRGLQLDVSAKPVDIAGLQFELRERRSRSLLNTSSSCEISK